MSDDVFGGENLSRIFGGAKRMQERIDNVKKDLVGMRIVGSAGGGIARVTIDGERRALKVEIAEEGMADRAMLEDLLVSAFADAMSKAEKAVGEKIQSSLQSSFSDVLRKGEQ